MVKGAHDYLMTQQKNKKERCAHSICETHTDVCRTRKRLQNNTSSRLVDLPSWYFHCHDIDTQGTESFIVFFEPVIM